MKTNYAFIVCTLSILLFTGCTSTQATPTAAPASLPTTEAETATIPPPAQIPTDTVTPTPPAVDNLFSFDEMGVSVGFNYPGGFTQGADTAVVGVHEPEAPFELKYPQHARILFTAYSGGSQEITADGIRVFRVDDVNSLEAGVIENLAAVLQGEVDHHTDFPRFGGAGALIDAQLSPLAFQNGNGYRYLFTKSFDATPIRDTKMTYLYQGITTDEKYFVSVIFTVDAPFLSSYVNQNLTTNDEFATYYQTVNDLVNSTGSDQFEPSLSVLDTLVSSIIIVER